MVFRWLRNIIVAWVKCVRCNRNGQDLKGLCIKPARENASPPPHVADGSVGQRSLHPGSIEAAVGGSTTDIEVGRDYGSMVIPTPTPDESRPRNFDRKNLSADAALDPDASRSVSPSNRSTVDHGVISDLGEELLEQGVLPSREGLESFIPNSEWQRLVTLEAILNELNRDRGMCIDSEVERYAEKILRDAPRLFAALVCAGLSKFVFQFIDEEIDDTHIPFLRCDKSKRIRFCSRKTPRQPIKCMESWTRNTVIEFVRLQRSLCAPVFHFGDEVEHQVFDDSDVLPFTETRQRDAHNRSSRGGFGIVWEAKIHPAHQLIHGRPDTERRYASVAVKELVHDVEADFNTEVEMLKTFRELDHPHLVKLLGTYRYKGRYFLLFPWANSTLRQYWQDNARPDFSVVTMLWLLQQFKAIASALHIIHEHRSSGDSLNAPSSSPPGVTAGNEGVSRDNVRIYGRHGDIKPENILWFFDENADGPDCGHLIIADFGLTDIHRRGTRSVIPMVSGSATYEPPEVVTAKTVSREYDIWSLGCTFLEFVTWGL